MEATAIFFHWNKLYLWSDVYRGLGGDYSTIGVAIAAASSGDTLLLLSGNTFHTTSTITVNKSLTIEGQDQVTCVIVPTAAVGTTVSVTTSNVTLRNFTIYNSSTSSVATCVGAGSSLSNLVFDSLKAYAGEFAIIVKQSSFQITNCTFFETQTDSHRFVSVDGNQGDSLINNNTWTGMGTQSRFILLTNNSTTFTGSLTASNNSQNGGPLQQFLIMESFTGSHFSLVVDGNSYAPTSGGVIFYSSINDYLDLFDLIQITNNTDTGTHGAGILKVDAPSGPVTIASNTDPDYLASFIKMYGNTNMTITAPGYVAGAVDGQIGYNTAVVNPFFVNLDPGPPSGVTVSQKVIRFLVQGDIEQHVSWTSSENAQSYRVYLNSLSNLIADTSNTFYNRHQCIPGSYVTYYTTAVSSSGGESAPASISVQTIEK